ncbi:hypothetical protein QU487_10505 [Crenobacter sp. SG2305]|uniref:hypothetical protein n=1 Tax=Crenobacter oryzisoli TaxID=3056844 RepID=UPI0025AA37F8|nr:hypothetical protein [Crenobacter sp. SG2305]MDN0083181.1 hypothetical protein [Crenobacter sp. SG2305]
MTRTIPLLLVMLASATALTACGKQDTAKVQEAASSAIGETHKALQAASTPLADIKKEASTAASKAKQKLDALAASSPAIGGAVDSLKGIAKATQKAGQWALLQTEIGKYPNDIKLYDDSAITPDLKALLGDKFATFKKNMEVSGPLQRERILYVLGNRKHHGGKDAAYLLIDTENQKLEVGLWEKSKLTTYASPGEPLFKPKDVLTTIQNNQG